MRLILKKFEVSAGRPIIFMHHDDAALGDIGVGDRVQVSVHGKKILGRVDLVNSFIGRGEVAVTDDVQSYLGLKPGVDVDVSIVPNARSSVFITKKMNGKALTKEEIRTIISDIVNNALTEVEIAEFVVSVYRNGMNHRETIDLTDAMCNTGAVLKWHSKIIADKHCIGGIAGNRTTPIVVSICAALGIVMPKTSSRAITSAAGTADAVECVARVDFPASELQRIVKKTGACLAWGGSLGLAPADDKLIRIERVLRLDPDAQLIASILSKKLAVGSTHALIDIPYGEGAKVTKERASYLRERFLEVGKHFGLTMRILLTNGSEPIGNGIGPVLEMIDVLKVLEQKEGPKDLEEKSIMLAGEIIELVHGYRKGEGARAAKETLQNGKALKKFNEIVDAQGRSKNKLVPAKLSRVIVASKAGKITHLDNKKINRLATILGCPADKGAGIYLYKHVGDKVAKGEKLMMFYAQSKEKMNEAVTMYGRDSAVDIR